MREVLSPRQITSQELLLERIHERKRKETAFNLNLGELAILSLVNPLAVAHEATTLAIEPELVVGFIEHDLTEEELAKLAEDEEIKLSHSA